MALRLPYHVVERAAGGATGGWDQAKYADVFGGFGQDLVAQPQLFRARRPAIFAVPSRLNDGRFHAVYYEDAKIYDPTKKAVPYELADVLNSYIFVYQWTPRPSTPDGENNHGNPACTPDTVL